jgi:hypothetical protein
MEGAFMVHKIQVIGSICQKVNYYAKLVEAELEKLGLNIDVELIQVGQMRDEGETKLLENNNLNYRCALHYCPGCNFFNTGKTDKQFLPSLVIDDEVIIHSTIPDAERIRETLISKLTSK